MALDSGFLSHWDPPYGFAIRRNGSCHSEETECYATWGGFWGCCPGASTCPGAEKYVANNVCCPSDADCTEQLNGRPHCANTTWTMFDHDGYFCCDKGQFGFWTSYPEGNFGCSDGYPNDANFSTLNPVSQGSSSGTSITSTKSTQSTQSSTSAPTSLEATESSEDSGSSTNSGAIAGGVVGGIAGVALIVAAVWFFLRRRKSDKPSSNSGFIPFEQKSPLPDPSSPNQPHYAASEATELEPRTRPPELDSAQPRSVHELP